LIYVTRDGDIYLLQLKVKSQSKNISEEARITNPRQQGNSVRMGTDCNQVLLQQDELGEAKSAPAG